MGVSQSILSGPMNQRAVDGTGSGIGGIIEIKMAAKLYIDNARSIATSSCRAALVDDANCEYIISFKSRSAVALSVKYQMKVFHVVVINSIRVFLLHSRLGFI